MTTETEVADLTVAAEDLAATVVNVRNALQGSATTVLSQQATITADIATVNAGIATINANLAAIGEMANKVDKVAGKGLSANDYTDAEKTKLAGLSGGGGGGGPTAWADVTDKPAVIAAGATAADARTAIGAGTSNLAIGSGAGDAMAGNTTIPAAPTWSTITGKPAVIAAGADAATARAAIGAGTSNLVVGAGAGDAMAGNTAILPDAPSNGTAYVRKDAAWVAETAGGGGAETVYAITDGGSVTLNPTNGGIQTWTLGANRTPAASFASGEGITLMVAGTAYTVTWTTAAVTWLTSDGNPPTLNATIPKVIVLWKVGSTLYGK